MIENLFFDVCAPVLSTASMRSLDAAEKESRGGDPVEAGYELMCEAGRALFDRVVTLRLECKTNGSKSVAVFVGGGNNGGDGLVLARLLQDAGIPYIVFSLVNEGHFKGEAKLALEDFLACGGLLNVVEKPKDSFAKYFAEDSFSDSKINDACKIRVPDFSLIVDCMLGNGASGELRPAFAQMTRLINAWGIPVLAADAPTGYDSAKHCCRKDCVAAQETMLLGFPRLDAYVREGTVFGKVNVASLGYSRELVEKFAENVFLATDDLIQKLLPVRNDWGDKREQGSAVIVAGSANMPGAAALCTSAALRSGAGLVTLATPKSVFPIVASKLSEPVFMPLCENSLCAADIPNILKTLRHANSLAVGPGLSTAGKTQEAVVELLQSVDLPTVIDADALNALSALRPAWESLSAPAILTPQVREFARLFGELPSAVKIPEMLREKSRECGMVIVLKGAPTFIAIPDGRVFVVPVANSGMAKGGSGDVLTGILVSLLSMGMNVDDAAVLGVLLHQYAGQVAKEKLGAFSMLPSDVVELLPKAFKV